MCFDSATRSKEEQAPTEPVRDSPLDGALGADARFTSQRQRQQQADDSPGVQELTQLQARLSDSGSDPKTGSGSGNGLPGPLKAGIEMTSGLSMDDVRVHYNSPKPAQLQAAAYAQGSQIHVAPGQQQHLAHEAWHVVQQKQGRVKPTTSVNGTRVNDDPALEREADRLGGEASRAGASMVQRVADSAGAERSTVQRTSNTTIVQLKDDLHEDGIDDRNYLTIRITNPDYEPWRRDVDAIDFDHDLDLFRQLIHDQDPDIEHVGQYQGVGDHEEVFARTATGEWIKMDMTGAGSRIIYPAREPEGKRLDSRETTDGLTLSGLFRTFFEVARNRPYHPDEYNCKRFAADLSGELTDPQADHGQMTEREQEVADLFS